MGMVNSLVFNAAPYILSLMVSAYGWQNTWRYLAVISAVVFLVFSWFFFRDNPESCGLVVDGIDNGNCEVEKEMEGITIGEAKQSITFKAITFTLSLYAMTFTGIAFHLEAIGMEAGLSKESAMAIFIPITFITIPVGFLTAWLSDRVPMKKLVMALAFCQACAYFSFTFIDSSAGYYSTILFLGLTGGLFGPIMTIAYPWFFGRLHLGAINGKVTSFLVIFSALGPMLFSLVKDFSGSFEYALYICAALPILAFFICTKMSLQKMY